MNDDELAEEDFEALYDHVSNDKVVWAEQAKALFESADILSEQAKQTAYDRNNVYESFHRFNMMNIIRMLNGMGMECILKAVWISAGNIMAEGGEMKRSLKTRAHDLFSMASIVCAAVSIPISEAEGMVLARLAYAIETGRYPTTTSFGKHPSMPNQETPWLHRWVDEDEQLFRGFVAKLMAKLL